ncbi:kinetochore-associated protein NSL1 homolog isoform X1 [Xenopus tropicalis]|uniref:Kinetochore-associated protein NSL1 homolog isoform X1 n=1 Tax=Xenopus tropicalis TaxID=8364 RepID=A0A6I8Q2C1_XENTR|nr:kinetochore-associated protein NSL1 homolog isoform X1 [Xenopus tropicalis]
MNGPTVYGTNIHDARFPRRAEFVLDTSCLKDFFYFFNPKMAAISGGGSLRRSGRLKVVSPGTDGGSAYGVSAPPESAGRTVSGNIRGAQSQGKTRETRYARRNRARGGASVCEYGRDGRVSEGKDSGIERPEPPTKSKAPSPTKPETPTKNKAPSPTKPETPTNSKAPSPKKPETPTKSKAFSPKKPETPTKSKAPSPKKPETPTKSKAPSSKKPETPTKSKAPSPKKPETPTKSKAPSPKKPETPTNSKAPSPAKPETPTKSKAPSLKNPETPTKSKAPSLKNPETPTKSKAPSPKKPETPTKSKVLKKIGTPTKSKAPSPKKIGTPTKSKAPSPKKIGTPTKSKAPSPKKIGTPTNPRMTVTPTKDKAPSPIKAEIPNRHEGTSPVKVGDSRSGKAHSPIIDKVLSPTRAGSPISAPSRIKSSSDESPAKAQVRASSTGNGTVLSPVKSGLISKRKAASPTVYGSPSKRKAHSPAGAGSIDPSKVANSAEAELVSGTKRQNPVETGTVTKSKAQYSAEVHKNTEHQDPSTKCGTRSPGKQRLSNNVQGLLGNEQPVGQLSQVPNERIIHGCSESNPSRQCESSLSASSRAQGSSEAGPSSESGTGIRGTLTSNRDPRIRCSSKQIVQEVLAKCIEFSKEVMESQQHVSMERREQELRNCTWDFEKAFQENITINGQAWHEAPETQNEPDIKLLEDKLDDAIVDTALKRKRYPRKILSHVVKMLKTEREIMAQTKPAVEPEEIKIDSQQASRMLELTAVTTNLSKQISETMKALPAQIEKASGFSHVLSLQPILESSRTRKEIFCSQVKMVDLAKKLPRAVESTPRETGAKVKPSPALSRRRQRSQSPEKKLYPLRSKRKISLSS